MSRRIVFDDASGQRVPVHVWGRDVNEATVRQLQRVAAQPYVIDHVCAMPDAHVSDGISVGTVFATEHTVVPRALGGDLGCGVTALRLGTPAYSPDARWLERVLDALGRAIPAGESLHRGRGVDVPDALRAAPLSTHALDHARDRLAPHHLGTLGGGNHFVEIDRDADGALWLLVHSGSRGLGGAIAHHQARAAGGGLDGLDTRGDRGAGYFDDQRFALDFARCNRAVMVARARDVIGDAGGFALDDASEPIDVHHNFVARERWLDRELLVHRKGAICASDGERAVIPGSMGTASYVVRGHGARDAFGSASHGAGRTMSRTEARRAITPRALEATMRRVVFDRRIARELVEEAPQAYRAIGDVLDDEADLVTREVRLEPLAVLKGGRGRSG